MVYKDVGLLSVSTSEKDVSDEESKGREYRVGKKEPGS